MACEYCISGGYQSPVLRGCSCVNRARSDAIECSSLNLFKTKSAPRRAMTRRVFVWPDGPVGGDACRAVALVLRREVRVRAAAATRLALHVGGSAVFGAQRAGLAAIFARLARARGPLAYGNDFSKPCTRRENAGLRRLIACWPLRRVIQPSHTACAMRPTGDQKNVGRL